MDTALSRPTPANAKRLTDGESAALAAARALTGEMKRIARTADDVGLARATDQWLMRVATLFAWRQRERSRISGATAAPARGGQDQLLNATRQMQETQMAFNLQYLQLQNQMQHENRSYTAISNIMKTKHDTVKNSISNVR